MFILALWTEIQCVTASKKLTYKKLQADVFERKIISFEVTVTEIFKQNKHKLSIQWCKKTGHLICNTVNIWFLIETCEKLIRNF